MANYLCALCVAVCVCVCVGLCVTVTACVYVCDGVCRWHWQVAFNQWQRLRCRRGSASTTPTFSLHIRIQYVCVCEYIPHTSHLSLLCICASMLCVRITRRMTICKYVFNWFVIIIVAVRIVFLFACSCCCCCSICYFIISNIASAAGYAYS